MKTVDTSGSKDQTIDFTLAEIPDKGECKIIMAITDLSKTVSQICRENDLPQSSTYRKIKRLLNAGLITIESVNIDERGKRVVFYKSKVKSLEINLQARDVLMKYNAVSHRS